MGNKESNQTKPTYGTMPKSWETKYNCKIINFIITRYILCKICRLFPMLRLRCTFYSSSILRDGASRASGVPGGGGYSHLFRHTMARAKHLPFTQNISGISSTQKLFEILAPPKNIPHSVSLRRDHKMHRNNS